MAEDEGRQDEYDSPWKEVLERFFEDAVRFFFPVAHAGIDWTRGYEFLDTELQQVVRDAELGRRWADKLVRVWRSEGEEVWVLIHLEVQGQVDAAFAQRMYVYNYRIFDRYDRKVASFAILGDDRPGWRPDHYGYEIWGCSPGIRFPIVKLLDYQPGLEDLERAENPFGVVVAAHLQTLATRGAPESRYEWKLRLAKGLYDRGWTRGDVLDLFNLIDWLMWLPKELDERFGQELAAFEEERKMPYVNSIERIRLAREREEGQLDILRESIFDILATRFHKVPDTLRQGIEALSDLERLRALRHQSLTTTNLHELEEKLSSPE